jgi:ABC-type lipoprotein export system ATPase subunit
VRTIAQNTTPVPEIPYRGIESLRFVDQRVFCAREEETWDLLSNILINRGVLLYGDSGSGKSSLINAGLIPAAIKESLYALIVFASSRVAAARSKSNEFRQKHTMAHLIFLLTWPILMQVMTTRRVLKSLSMIFTNNSIDFAADRLMNLDRF